MSPLRVSLVCNVCTQAVRRRASVFLLAYVVGMFVPHAFTCIPCTVVSLHKETDPHTSKTFSVVCGAAFFVRATSAKGAAKRRRKTAREYRQAHRTRPAIRKRDGAVPVEPQEAGRADASRSLYCCGGLSLCLLNSRWIRAGNDKLSGSPLCRQALFLPAGNFFLCCFPFFFGEEGKQRPWNRMP